MAESKKWALESAGDVAQALDWVRRRMEGKGLLLIAVGANSVAVSKDTGIEPDEAADTLENVLPVIRKAFHKLKRDKVTRGCAPRED